MRITRRNDEGNLPSWKIKMDLETTINMRLEDIDPKTEMVTLIIAGEEVHALKGEQIYLNVPFEFRRDKIQ